MMHMNIEENGAGGISRTAETWARRMLMGYCDSPATCPRDTGIVGGCGMVDQPMLRDVPPATTDERFFRVIR